jgi:hypothetical protein
VQGYIFFQKKFPIARKKMLKAYGEELHENGDEADEAVRVLFVTSGLAGVIDPSNSAAYYFTERTVMTILHPGQRTKVQKHKHGTLEGSVIASGDNFRKVPTRNLDRLSCIASQLYRLPT